MMQLRQQPIGALVKLEYEARDSEAERLKGLKKFEEEVTDALESGKFEEIPVVQGSFLDLI